MQKMFTNHKKRQFVLSIWRNMEVEKNNLLTVKIVFLLIIESKRKDI